ncbi:hypothetical protein NDU88_000975 [Pleurodeles waltl]|uniref:Uncharacterized protein n=1 Tax=Pleurodeles waltl TaxID=8319 RepID=A0AAV7M6U8_PLEWA|nr:hypothetical protein NDU88_000975 [Pleurodeles waltl]
MNRVGRSHPLILSGQLMLMAWQIRWKYGVFQAFCNKLLATSSKLGLQGPTNAMLMHGRDGVIGVANGVLIPQGLNAIW